MKTKQETIRTGKAFTIIELLTVMSIIVILFGLLVPAMQLVKKSGKDVKQQAQFHAIDAGLQLYHEDFQGYPPSDRLGGDAAEYPGACKLAEAMVGWDLLGFHEKSIFASDGTNAAVSELSGVLYPKTMTVPPNADESKNIESRKGPYVDVSRINVNKISDLWSSTSNPSIPTSTDILGPIVITDEYPNYKGAKLAKRIGMPILYFKANISNIRHEYNFRTTSIYNWEDNIGIVNQVIPSNPTYYSYFSNTGTTPNGQSADPNYFYTVIKNPKISSVAQPYNPDSYLLISAGNDSIYGTNDDQFNFQK